MRSKASGAGASSTSQRPSRSRVGRAVPMPYRRAGERPRAAAGGRLRLQRHHLRRRAPARRALRRDLRRDRDRGLARALLRRVRRATPTPRSSSACCTATGRYDPAARRAAARPADRALPGAGRERRDRASGRRGVRARDRRRACRSPSRRAPRARRSRPCSWAPACRSLFDVIVAAEDVARGKPDPLGLPDRARRGSASTPPGRCLRGHPLRGRGGGRGGDAVRRRWATRSTADGSATPGAEAVVACLDWSIPTVRGLFA